MLLLSQAVRTLRAQPFARRIRCLLETGPSEFQRRNETPAISELELCANAVILPSLLASARSPLRSRSRAVGFGRRHHYDRREATSGAAAEIRRRDQGKRHGFDALVAAACRAAQGRAQRAAHHDRRPGLWRSEHLRRCHPDAGTGSHRQGRAALHAVPLHRALLADAGGADHRPQPPLGRLRRNRRTVHWLSRL